MYKKALLAFNAMSIFSVPITTIIHQGINEHGPQAEIYQLALQYEALNETKSAFEFAKMPQNIGVVSDEQLGIKIPTNNSLHVKLHFISKNVNQKSVYIMYFISKQGFSEASGFITIFGADYSEQKNHENSEIVNRIISKFASNQDTKHRDFYPHNWSINQEVSAEELGIIEPQKDGATIKYQIQSIDLLKGQVIVKVDVQKIQTFDSKIITIKNFETTHAYDLKIAEKILNHVPYNQPTTLKIFPKWKINDQVSGQELNLNKLDGALQQYYEFNLSYLIKNIDFAIGEIKADAIVTKKGQIIKIKQEITIDNFLSQDDFDEENLNDAIAKIIDTTSTLSHLVPNWEINTIVSRQELGIGNLNFKNIETQYKIIEVDDEKGIVEVEVSFKVNNKIKTKKIMINGFKSKHQNAQEIVDRVKKTLIAKYNDINLDKNSPFANKLPSQFLNKMFVNLNAQELFDFNIPNLSDEEKQDTTIDYQIITFNDIFGDIVVEAIVSKGDVVAGHIFKVQGFDTITQRNKQLVKNAYDQILAMNNLNNMTNIIELDDNSSLRKYVPSKFRINVDDVLEQKQLKNLNIILPSNLKVDIKVVVINISDINGTIYLNVSIQKGNEIKTIKITVQGFRTKQIQDQFDVEHIKEFLQDKYKDVHIVLDSLDRSKMASEIQSQLPKGLLSKKDLEKLNIEYPQLESLGHVNSIFKIKTINDGSGQIIINVTLTQDSAQTNFDFIVKGFQTQNERNQLVVEKLIIDFARDNINKAIDLENPLNQKTISEIGYKLDEVLSGQKLNNLHLIYNQDDLEVEWDFKVINMDEKNGSITLKITAKKGLNTRAVLMKIKGFKKA